jgi:hypothetical protein
MQMIYDGFVVEQVGACVERAMQHFDAIFWRKHHCR